MTAEISISESARLVALEKVIERGLSSFIEVGEALWEIRDSKLYRIEFKTFENYCRKKWGFKRHNAFDLIDTASAAKNVEDIQQPRNRETARPLTKLDSPADQREAWQAAVDASDGKPTAKHVEAAVNSRIRPISEPELSPNQKSKATVAEKDSDTLWHLKGYWKKASKKDRAAFRAWIESYKK